MCDSWSQIGKVKETDDQKEMRSFSIGVYDKIGQ